MKFGTWCICFTRLRRLTLLLLLLVTLAVTQDSLLPRARADQPPAVEPYAVATPGGDEPIATSNPPNPVPPEPPTQTVIPSVVPTVIATEIPPATQPTNSPTEPATVVATVPATDVPTPTETPATVTVDGLTVPPMVESVHDVASGQFTSVSHLLTVSPSAENRPLGFGLEVSEGWSARLVDGSLNAPILDSDGNGMADIPASLSAGLPTSVVIELSSPADAEPGNTGAVRLLLYVSNRSPQEANPDAIILSVDRFTVTSLATAEAGTPAPTTTTGPELVEIAILNASQRGDPGAIVTYQFELRNFGSARSVEIDVTSSTGWSVDVNDADADENQPTTRDRDKLEVLLQAIAPRTLTVQLTIPPDALANAIDNLTVSVRAVSESEESDVIASAVATTTVNPVVTMIVDGSAESFGAVSPLGTLDPAIEGLTSESDADGATYVKTAAIVISITANTNWTLACRYVPANGTDMINETPFAFRLTGDSGWLSFATEPEAVPCASGGPGSTVITLDLRLRVRYSDPPGMLGGVIQFDWDY